MYNGSHILSRLKGHSLRTWLGNNFLAKVIRLDVYFITGEFLSKPESPCKHLKKTDVSILLLDVAHFLGSGSPC